MLEGVDMQHEFQHRSLQSNIPRKMKNVEKQLNKRKKKQRNHV